MNSSHYKNQQERIAHYLYSLDGTRHKGTNFIYMNTEKCVGVLVRVCACMYVFMYMSQFHVLETRNIHVYIIYMYVHAYTDLHIHTYISVTVHHHLVLSFQLSTFTTILYPHTFVHVATPFQSISPLTYSNSMSCIQSTSSTSSMNSTQTLQLTMIFAYFNFAYFNSYHPLHIFAYFNSYHPYLDSAPHSPAVIFMVLRGSADCFTC